MTKVTGLRPLNFMKSVKKGSVPVSVLILTRNEEKHIRACIESASFANEIIITDSGSTDKTIEIAESLGAKVYQHPMSGFADQRNFVKEKASNDWIFYLDADERITPEAAEAISEIVLNNKRGAYNIKRYQYVFGQKMKYGGHGPDFSLRLYPKDEIRWEGVVHEAVITDLEIKLMGGTLDHYTYTDWDRYFIKFNNYTTLMAKKMYENGKRATFADIVFHPIGGFLKFFIFNRGFLDGKMGFILACYHYFYTMAKYVKLYYMDWKA